MPIENSIVLIDDDAAVLDSLRMALTNRGMAVECFASAEGFLARDDVSERTCIVADVRMPGLSGLDLQDELGSRNIATPLILMTGHGDIAMAVRAIKAGAFDFIEKPFDNEKLINAITRAAANRLRDQAQQDERADWATRVRDLSVRQRQVMELVAQGLSNKEIAINLRLSPRTVENYRAWVMEKMCAKSLADLVRMVVLVGEMPDGPKN
jgi:two-component system, LuxR family, response regulator FixJ